MNLKIPTVSKELVEWLENITPDKCPDPAMTDREIWIMAGKAELVRKIRCVHETQTTNALKDYL